MHTIIHHNLFLWCALPVSYLRGRLLHGSDTCQILLDGSLEAGLLTGQNHRWRTLEPQLVIAGFTSGHSRACLPSFDRATMLSLIVRAFHAKKVFVACCESIKRGTGRETAFFSVDVILSLLDHMILILLVRVPSSSAVWRQWTTATCITRIPRVVDTVWVGGPRLHFRELIARRHVRLEARWQSCRDALVRYLVNIHGSRVALQTLLDRDHVLAVFGPNCVHRFDLG